MFSFVFFQGDLGARLCVNRNGCHLLSPYKVTYTELNKKERKRKTLMLTNVIDLAAPASEVSLRSPHLSVCHLLHLFRSPQRYHDCSVFSLFSISFFFTFVNWLVQDHGCLAACSNCLTDSGWLPPPPTLATYGF